MKKKFKNRKSKKNTQQTSNNEQNADKNALTAERCVSTADVNNSCTSSYVCPENIASCSSHSSLPQPQGSVRYYNTSYFDVPEWFQTIIDDLSNRMEIRHDDYFIL